MHLPFLAFHYLDEEEEIQLFDTINTKAKGIGTSLSRYLKRGSDDNSWIATELITRGDSPFHFIGSLTGKRNAGRHVTLQNLYKLLEILFKPDSLKRLSKEDKLMLVLIYFNNIKELFNKEWLDYKNYRISHIVSLNALAIAGSEILLKIANVDKKNIDYQKIPKYLEKIVSIDWSSNGPLKYIKGLSGSKALAIDLVSLSKIN
jgi:DNA sulfur modification protein DndB